jgi:hypothetical protein
MRDCRGLDCFIETKSVFRVVEVLQGDGRSTETSRKPGQLAGVGSRTSSAEEKYGESTPNYR